MSCFSSIYIKLYLTDRRDFNSLMVWIVKYRKNSVKLLHLWIHQGLIWFFKKLNISLIYFLILMYIFQLVYVANMLPSPALQSLIWYFNHLWYHFMFDSKYVCVGEDITCTLTWKIINWIFINLFRLLAVASRWWRMTRFSLRLNLSFKLLVCIWDFGFSNGFWVFKCAYTSFWFLMF